jgi:hypothetical protein
MPYFKQYKYGNETSPYLKAKSMEDLSGVGGVKEGVTLALEQADFL